MEKIYKFLDKNHFEYYHNFDISGISSIKIGMVASLVIFPKTVAEFEKLLMCIYSRKIMKYVTLKYQKRYLFKLLSQI